MNIEPQQIERLLRKGPRPAAPAGLLEKLKADIDLPSTPRVERDRRPAASFLRRWLPALSVAIWLLACVIILAVQSSLISSLRTENEDLRAAASQSEQMSAKSPIDELAKLRADNEEVRRLKAEVARLRQQLNELESLQAENRRLVAELEALNSAKSPPQDDFFGKAAEKAENMKCVQNLKLMALAGRMWASDSSEYFPEDFNSVCTEEIRKGLESYGQFPDLSSIRKLARCPARGGTVAYRIISPGLSEEDPAVVYAQCPTHGFVSLADGSVLMLRNPKLVVRPDGKTVVGPGNAAQ